jgi:hypothetical protein
MAMNIWISLEAQNFLGSMAVLLKNACLLRCDAMHFEVLGGGLQFATNISEELAFSICRAKDGAVGFS